MSNTYLPGVRNLDATEVTQRRNGGRVGLALTVMVAGALVYFQVGARWRLLLFFPVTMAAIGFLQASSKFCVMVALSSRSPAHNADERTKDRRKALWLIAAAILIGMVVAVGAYFQ